MDLIGAEKVAALQGNPAKVLAEPYRKWILSQDETEKITAATNN